MSERHSYPSYGNILPLCIHCFRQYSLAPGHYMNDRCEKSKDGEHHDMGERMVRGLFGSDAAGRGRAG